MCRAKRLASAILFGLFSFSAASVTTHPIRASCASTLLVCFERRRLTRLESGATVGLWGFYFPYQVCLLLFISQSFSGGCTPFVHVSTFSDHMGCRSNSGTDLNLAYFLIWKPTLIAVSVSVCSR